ncbi:peptidoglycan-binding protein [Actinocrispum wychmicini]|uniref:Peptidoglycan hydrolase-like protein with peptidoglycan-binding domain n=1 Tax=Actinocrispum wychmicini TaxID=1213861 RepID=A0A4R2JEH1_9PSEU|nr:peptidoglycan-binding protein [Actinocrispum wychmicini]TCO56917.1 peptidoglycan hydrolase-like protein with peptidoglycan-binding domain [Actinocrispum wychmicini]
MATSQNGWPASPNPSSIDIAAFSVAGIPFPGGVKSGDVATVLGYVAEQFHNRVEQLITPGCWGYNYRPISGGNSLSNHSSGTAIDLSAPRHPLGQRGTFSGAQVAEIHRILAEVDNTVRWGGDYTGRVDEMHMEINTDPGRVATVAARIRGGGDGPTPQPPGPGHHRTLSRGSTGADVALVQRYLGIAADGIFGPATDAAVRTYQHNQGLTADGIVGPATWARIDSGLGHPGTDPGSDPAPTRPTLRKGSTGPAVRELQTRLNTSYPAYSHLVADGDFGPATEQVVREFQRRAGLTVDGIVGPHTWARVGF